MKMPERKGAPQQFTLRRSAGSDVRFEGWLVAQVSTRNPDAVEAGASRWRERAVYVTKSGNVVCHKLGRSTVPGEVDRGQVLVLTRPTPEGTVQARGEAATGPMTWMDLYGSTRDDWPDAKVREFFHGDSHAKELFAALEIENFTEID